MHFFDGFRTSHEVSKIEKLTTTTIRAMIDEELVKRPPRARAEPGPPGDARHRAEPGRLFQAREACNPSTTPARASSRQPWTASPS
jgi:pyruvate-ferredoxin/flavodoxin oxidoreductase